MSIINYQYEKQVIFLLWFYLPSSRSFRGPYLSMTMPMGRVMADSRKEPTVKARFSISSWALQMGQLFISKYSSESASVKFHTLRLEEFPGWWRRVGLGPFWISQWWQLLMLTRALMELNKVSTYLMKYLRLIFSISLMSWGQRPTHGLAELLSQTAH